MFAGEKVLRALEEAARGGDVVHDAGALIEAGRGARFDVSDASMRIFFSKAPTASALSAALEEIDRQARRTATALEKKRPPSTLFGRGVHLKPLADGLVVERADAGSLDVLLLLGGLYGTVISDPVSFALNVSSLLGYGRMAFRAVLPSGKERHRDVLVAPTSPPQGLDDNKWPADTIEVPTAYGTIRVPTNLKTVSFVYEAADGTKLAIHAEPTDAPS